MERRNDEVPRERRLDRHVSRFFVANFADHNDIGVLAQNGAQGVGEVEPDFWLYLDLIEVFVDHFDGVFDRRDVDFGRR